MRGVEPLIAMRRRGKRPAVVFIDADAGPRALPSWAQWQNVDGSMADVDIEASESLLRIDWRPFVGLTVHVSGSNADRVTAIAKQLTEAGAKRVVSSLVRQIGVDEFVAFETVWIRDTAKELAHG